MLRGFASLGVVVALCLVIPALSAGVPVVSLAELTATADAIIIGRVEAVRELSPSNVEVSGQRFPAREMIGEIAVDKALKGGPFANRVTFHFELPVTPAGGIGFRGIPNDSYRLVFLVRAGSNYDFASPYYPSFPAVPATQVRGEAVYDQVIFQLVSVIRATQTSREDKLASLFALKRVNTGVVISGLQDALKTDDPVLQLSVAAALLERNDLSGLSVAESALIHPPPSLPSYVLENLSSAVSRSMTA